MNQKQFDHNDYMELGDTGIVPLANGWFKNTKTNETMSPTGQVYDENGDPVLDEESEEEYDEDGSGGGGYDFTD